MAHDAVLKILRFLTLPEKNLEVRDGKELGRGAYGRVFMVKYCGHSFAPKETQEKISENSGYFGIRDCHLNDRKVVTYSEQR